MGMRRYQCHFTRCEFKIDSKSKWLEHLAVEHRLGTNHILRKHLWEGREGQKIAIFAYFQY